MKEKIIWALGIIVVIGIVVYALFTRGDKVEYEKKAIYVDVLNVQYSVNDKEISYIGTVRPSSIEKISFKSTARLEKLSAKVGDVIKDGEEFIKLDTSDLELALKASENKLAAAKAQYSSVLDGAKSQDKQILNNQVKQASEQVDYLQKLYDDTSVLFKNGYASKKDLDDIEIKLKVAREDLKSAKENLDKANKGATGNEKNMAYSDVERAKTGVEADKAMIEDATYIVKGDKVVVDTKFEEGELVPAGYVVAIVRDIKKDIVIALTGEDKKLVGDGDNVRIEKDGKKMSGKIKRISDVPDMETFLYLVDVEYDADKDDEFDIGEVVDCRIKVGEYKGIKVPLNAIMKDKIDYVFVCDDENIVKIKEVKIIEENEGMLVVDGLEEGDRVIINNLGKISENDEVVVNEN